MPVQSQKTLDQFRTPMVGGPTSAARMGAAYNHLRRANIEPRGADRRKAIGSRDVACAVMIHAGRACPPQYIPPAPQAQNAGHRLLPSMRHWCTLAKSR